MMDESEVQVFIAETLLADDDVEARLTNRWIKDRYDNWNEGYRLGVIQGKAAAKEAGK
jgi:hypothetical protein